MAGAACGYPSLPKQTADHDGGVDLDGSIDGGSDVDGSIDGSPTPVCGNGVLESGEDCEDKNTTDGDGCDHNCTFTRCGNGVKTVGEDCDDGNNITESCAYGLISCTVCDASCHFVAGSVSLCGDGRVDRAFETCDDGNTDACGTCSANCSAQVVARAATGQITSAAGSDLHRPDAFTLDDGITPTVTFHFFKSGDFAPTNPIRADDGDDSNTVAQRIVNAIRSTGLLITPAQVGITATITLMHREATLLGNRVIVNDVATFNFSVSGMSGGQAGDCSVNIGCVTRDDCATGFCSATGRCAACTQASQCASHFCNSGQCQVCTSDTQCTSPATCQSDGSCR